MRTVEGAPEGGQSPGKDIKIETNVASAGDTKGLTGTEVRVGGMMGDEAESGGQEKDGVFSPPPFYLPQPGIEPAPSAVKAQSPNHRTASKFPLHCLCIPARLQLTSSEPQP